MPAIALIRAKAGSVFDIQKELNLNVQQQRTWRPHREINQKIICGWRKE